jgi:hypothetical protein
VTLAKTLHDVLESFGVADKVRVTHSRGMGNRILTVPKVLCITCDNATNNLVMIRELEFELDGYDGEAGHAQCTTNLVAKSLLRAFEVRKGFPFDDDLLSADEQQLAQEIRDLSQVGNEDSEETHSGDDDDSSDDNVEGLEDEVERLTRDEQKELQKSIRPVQLALAKVRELLQCTSCDQYQSTDMQTELQNHQLHYQVAARVATNS